jgi:hypothetical protein
MRSWLTNSLRSITSLRSDWTRHGCGVGVPGALLSERLHHAKWAAEKVTISVAELNCRKKLNEKSKLPAKSVGYEKRLASVSSKKFDLPANVVNSLGVHRGRLVEKSSGSYWQILHLLDVQYQLRS